MNGGQVHPITLRKVRLPDSRGLTFPPGGPLPDLDWVPVSLMRVGAAYQRSLESERSVALIRRIAAGWSWAKYQPVNAARRACGADGGDLYAVIDGQHRLAAALLRGDIPNLPCYVMPQMSLADEAGAFMALNRDRLQVHQTALLKARLTSGDPDARLVVEVCAAAGVRLVSSGTEAKAGPGRTQAAGRLESLLKAHGRDMVLDALRAVRVAYDGRRVELQGPLIGAVVLALDGMEAAVDLDRLAVLIGRVEPQGWRLRGQLRRDGHSSLGAAMAAAIAEDYSAWVPA
jgi:hypothetical protein